MKPEHKWLAKHCPNANKEHYEPEDKKRYIYCEKYKRKCKPTDECIKLYFIIMFKTKEELKRDLKDPCSDWDRDGGFNDGVDSAFQSFAKRVAFYKKYMYDWQSLFKEHENLLEIWFKSEEYHFFKEEIENNNGFLAEEWYQDWLFDYCFGDIK